MTSTTSTTQDLPAMLANMSAASLFVGELLPHVNEVNLKHIIKRICCLYVRGCFQNCIHGNCSEVVETV